MSYKVEFDNDYEYYNNEHKSIDCYWIELSKYQKKRHNKVLQQMRNNWYSVYNTLNSIQYIDNNDTDYIMNKIYKLYFIHSKSNEDYYNQEKLIKRKNNKYISKKINKLKNKKYNL